MPRSLALNCSKAPAVSCGGLGALGRGRYFPVTVEKGQEEIPPMFRMVE